jgi:alkaline phosphatase
MNLTTTDTKAIPITIDKESRTITIMYGSLGTLIAFSSLIFAVLSWLRSRHEQITTQDHPSGGFELGRNTPRNISQTPLESHVSASLDNEYANNNKGLYLLEVDLA